MIEFLRPLPPAKQGTEVADCASLILSDRWRIKAGQLKFSSSQVTTSPASDSFNRIKIDKILLWSGLNIQKIDFCVKEIFTGDFYTRSWVCLGALSVGIGGISGVDMERGYFQPLARPVRRF